MFDKVIIFIERIWKVMIRNERFKTVEEEEEERRERYLKKQKEIEEKEKKEKEKLEAAKSKYKKTELLKDSIIALVISVVAFFVITRFLFFTAYVPTGSMKPSLNEGDRLIVTRLYNFENIKRGDMLVFKSDELKDTLVKRVIGLPGDYIVISSGVVSINGENLDEDYVVNKDNSNKKDGSYIVPEDSYFFLGDNRPVSNDAAFWETPYIPASKILGKVQIKIYPFSEFGSIK